MDPKFSALKFPISERVYRILLRAYPHRHRTEYGDMMEQFFCDQCRDSWNQSQNFGLLKLWLRVLPDLVNTSFKERMAALNERKSMNEKLAGLATFGSSPKGIFIRVFVLIFLLSVISVTAITFILPESFASTARIRIENPSADANKNAFDPYFMETQLEILNSEVVLVPVIASLHLNEVWGKKYSHGEIFKDDESLEILKRRLIIAPVRGVQVAAITVYSDNGKEAAKIANAIAESYRNYRIKDFGLKRGISQPAMVQLIDIAVPSLIPVKPNKPRNICFGVALGALVAGFCGGIAAWFASLIRKRRQVASVQA
ncbi:MAG TPA: hypothetical protein VGO57_09795 [Verrucomicrobiae bacterium]|jgi:capsular polysaccharide biosynthesis protein